jgi:6-phosphofructokinase 1
MDQNNCTIDTSVEILGTANIVSPIVERAQNSQISFITDKDRVLIDIDAARIADACRKENPLPTLECAGPRRKIYFDPSKIRCALVTCGGICPGLNAIIRSVVLELYYGYNVRHIYGIRYGLQGFIAKYQHDVMELSPEVVTDIMKKGGTILGSSRGAQDVDAIVDCLERLGIGALFMIGGDGTLVAATRITDAILSRGLKISVIGIPKTIDNDIHMVSRSFGFDTAVDVATQAIRAAHNEAIRYPNGIGLIKLMGRYSGFIAATATLAEQDINFVLIPEVDFDLDGPSGLLNNLEERLKQRGHAVIVAAEGAGQKFFSHKKMQKDESGNLRLQDIGYFLKNEIAAYFNKKQIDITIKYIDPSYIIRSLPANANDQVFCNFLGRNAVHAAMAGKTRVLVGHWNNHFVHVPMGLSAGKRKQVDPKGGLWRGVLAATGQGLLKNTT